MRIAVLAFAIVVLFQGALVAQDDPAEMLTILARPSRSERDTTLRRFRFVLPRIVKSCSDVTTETFAGDMIAFMHQKLEDAGLEREDGGYLGIANTFHGMLSEVSAIMGGPIKCADLLAAYALLREDGYSTSESRDAVPTLFPTLR